MRIKKRVAKRTAKANERGESNEDKKSELQK